MSRESFLIQVSVAVVFLLSACQPAVPLTPTVTATVPPAVPPTPAPMPFSEPGPYAVGTRKMIQYTDASRGDRPVTLTIWYPAEKAAATTVGEAVTDAPPDMSNAPYPVILSAIKDGIVFAPHMVSYGFAMVGVNGQDSQYWGAWLTDYPLDIVFALDQFASNPPEGLEGILDTGRAGAMGYSFDGFSSLTLGGARVDPDFYLAQCAQAGAMNPKPEDWWIDYICNMTGSWDNFVANAGASITTSQDGLWQPITDQRIRAVMPMAPEGAWLYGERGLAAMNRPTLIIGATNDTGNPYDLEAVYILEHISNPAPIMISFIGRDHGMIGNKDTVTSMKHFAVAFFGYHLQGKTDYANWFSEKFVNK
jgi:predicted dienelactone hydrolase